ncbi:hypothetical protein [Actinophytocola xinjiangensis]|uniref:hypothetical protein n=1 Tax=Actinophytocola xinjiangensis TaxID=485602 RepID=UPI000A5801B2|nr:hypothetical protein [Actinophytocola xinjiangensis]
MADRPEDVDAAFAEIVAGLEREGVGRMPDPDDPEPGTGGTALADDPPGERTADGPGHRAGDQATDQPTEETPRPAGPPPTAWRGSDTEFDWSWGTDEEHYVPPEPPPLPRLRPMTIIALVLIAVAIVLLFVPGVIGLSARVGTPIALIALTGGGVLLMLRVRKTPRHFDEGERDDGAQL